MARRPAQTLVDYLVVAISPVLIMLLVGSLSFFLIEVAYRGEFQGRLRFACAMFVMAAVLIGRISIEEGIEYAQLFAFPLAIATLLAMMRFVDANILVNILLIAVVWWSAHKLTWDCTVVDDQEAASGKGLLETVGLDPIEADKPDGAQLDQLNVSADAADDLSATTSNEQDGEQSFWQRLLRRSRRHHNPGVWVVYFAMASLPLFGLGQILLNEQGRGEAFRLLVIYVASTLGLLMTTSLLQLRRYLRQRHLQMPDQMAGSWLGVGSVMIIALLMLCMFLPRPSPDYSLTGLVRKVFSPEGLKPSRWSIGKEGVKDDQQQRPGESKSKQDGDQNSTEGGRETSDSAQSQRQGSDSSESDTNSQQQDGNQPSDNSSSNQRQQSDGQQSQSDSNQQQNGNSSDHSQQDDSSERRSGENQQQPSQQQSQSSDSESESESNGESQDGSDDSSSDGSDNADPSQTDDANTPPPASNPIQSLTNQFGPLLRILYWFFFAAIAAFLLWRYRDKVADALARFIRDLRALIAQLFGRDVTVDEQEQTIEETGPPLPAFSAYSNPFSSGAASRWSLSDLVRYSFEALEASAHEHQCERRPEQTPIEFAEQVGQRAAPLAKPAEVLAGLYSHIAYAKEQPTGPNTESVRKLWDVLG